MKIVPAILILLILQISIILFDNTFSSTDYNLNPYNQTYTVNGTVVSGEPIWNLLVNPIEWYNNSFMMGIIGLTAVAALITLGIYLIVKTETVLLGPLCLIIFGFGLVPIVNLYQVLNREVGYYACTLSSACTLSIILGLLITGPLIAIWAFAVLEFWTGRQTT